MIIWLEKPLILAIHARQIAEHGGDAALRDEGLLESALARPLQLNAYGEPSPDIADLAASLAHGLARNHPFVDGNKRTAHVAYRVFLAVNSVELLATEEDKYIAMMALAEGKLSERAFAEWLRPRLQLARRNEAHQTLPAYKAKTKRAAKKAALVP